MKNNFPEKIGHFSIFELPCNEDGFNIVKCEAEKWKVEHTSYDDILINC